MSEDLTLRPIGRIRTEFPEKFGIPRQSGLVEELRAVVEFEREFRAPEGLPGPGGVLPPVAAVALYPEPGVVPHGAAAPAGGQPAGWGCSPPGHPFRPNPIGLSCVKLEKVDYTAPGGPVLLVRGADLLDGTPIFDVKPYVPLADCRPQAVGGFSDQHREDGLTVDFPPALLEQVPEEKRGALLGVLAQDPRPSYQHDPQRGVRHGLCGLEVRFTVEGNILTVRGIQAKE